MKLKLRMSMKILAVVKKSLILLIIRLSQITMMIQKKLVIGKMTDETGGVVIEEFVGLKLKMHSFLVDNKENKKAKSVKKMLL